MLTVCLKTKTNRNLGLQETELAIPSIEYLEWSEQRSIQYMVTNLIPRLERSLSDFTKLDPLRSHFKDCIFDRVLEGSSTKYCPNQSYSAVIQLFRELFLCTGSLKIAAAVI